MYSARAEAMPWHESSGPRATHQSHDSMTIGTCWGGLGCYVDKDRKDLAEAGLKQAGLHRKVQLYPELASTYFCTSFCARFTFKLFVQNCQNVRLTYNHVQQYTMLGVAALASMLLQICTLKKNQSQEKNEFAQLIDLSSHAAILLQVCTQ